MALGVGTMFLGAASNSAGGFGFGVLIGFVVLIADAWFGLAQGVKRAVDEQGLLNPNLPSAPADALVLPMTQDPAPAIALAETLRAAGLRVQLYGEQKKFKQKMAYANKLAVPFAVLLGEDEIAEGMCSVKNMATGEQVKLTPQAAAEHIRKALDEGDCPVILEK